MLNSRILSLSMFSICLISLAAIGPTSAYGQNYPNRPIRIVTSEPGGGTDFAARILAQGISEPLGQRVIVDNRGNVLGGEIVATSMPDGYTLLFTGSTFWIGPLFRKTSYDPRRDFSPISLTHRQPLLIVVHPSVSANSVKELIDLAKAKPGALSYASSSIGASTHLAAELFKSMAGINIVHIPHKSTGAANTSLLSGEVQLAFASIPAAVPHIKAGKLRALGVGNLQPTALAPGVPTIAASGLPGFEAASILAIFAPPKTPPTIISRLNQEIVRLLNQADIKAKFSSAGSDTVGTSPKELADTLRAEVAKWGKVIKDAGIQPD